MPGPAIAVAAFTIEQRLIPGLLGIAIERVRELRGRVCVKGEDWIHESGRVLWSEGGVRKLKEALALPAGSGSGAGSTSTTTEPAAALPAPAQAPAPVPGGLRLKVWRTAPAIRNQRLVEVVWAEPREKQTVMRMYVRDNTQWRVGVTVGLDQVREIGPGLYEYLGGRAPQR